MSASSRYTRLWPHVGDGIDLVTDAYVYDNTRAARPYRLVARYEHGRPLLTPDWPSWAPEVLRDRD